MSMNYYIPDDAPGYEDLTEEERHIGKSSVGWIFLFQANPYIKSVKAWRLLLNEIGEVQSEYGSKQSVHDFFAFVENKQNSGEYESHIEYLQEKGYDDSTLFRDAEGYEFCTSEFF